MRMLSVVTLGFVALATAMANDFDVFYNDTQPYDLDFASLNYYEESGKVERILKALLGSDEAERALARVRNVPAAYKDTLQFKAEPMFDESSATNNESVEDEENDEDVDDDLAPAERDMAARSRRCPYKTLLLRWFFLRYQSYTYAFCFVPWARRQNITYARCRRQNCKKRTTQDAESRCCRLSSFQRRRVLVFCYHFYRGYWFWNWTKINLPRRCRCSFCPAT